MIRGLFYLPVLVAILFAGCNRGGDTVRVTGQLVKDGKPYGALLTGKEPETFVVDFVGKVKEQNYRFPATIAANGSFRVDGADRRGIPRGQYKLNVVHSGFLGAGGDRLGARFAGDNTPLTIEIEKNSHLTVDLSVGSVSK